MKLNRKRLMEMAGLTEEINPNGGICNLLPR